MSTDPSDATAALLAVVANRRGNRNPHLRSLLRLPDPLQSSGEAERFEHRDLDRLDAFDLAIERRRTELRILEDPRPSPWLRSRLQAIAAEQARRRAAGNGRDRRGAR